jgi:hypothetical protein
LVPDLERANGQLQSCTIALAPVARDVHSNGVAKQRIWGAVRGESRSHQGRPYAGWQWDVLHGLHSSSVFRADGSLGIFRGDGSSAVTQIARYGQVVPDGSGSFLTFREPTFNDANQAAFSATVGPVGGTGSDRIFRGDGNSLVQIVRDGQSDGSETLSNLGRPIINNAGQVAFTASPGILRSDGTAFTYLVRRGQAAPDGDGAVSGLSELLLNDAGQVAFSATLSDTSNTRGVFRSDGTSLVQIAREAQTAAGAIGKFEGFASLSLNDEGNVAFRAGVRLTSGPGVVGLFRGDGASVVQIARSGVAAPDGNGTISSIRTPVLNNNGQAVFTVEFSGTNSGIDDNTALFRGNGASLVQIAHEGQPAPDGKGPFSQFANATLNDAGQVAFWATTGIRTAQGLPDDHGLFFVDDALGFLTVAREGDAFLGSSIVFLSFNSGIVLGGLQGTGSGLNEQGEVAYHFSLADGRSGIAIATPPDPVDLTPGDTDFDGDVDLSDLGVLATNFGQSNGIFGIVNGDFDGDNDVDLNDLGTIGSNFEGGRAQAYAEFQALVPEPASTALVLGGLAMLTKGRRRHEGRR